MNRIINTLIIYLAALAASIGGAVALTSCEDHLVAPGYEDIPEGVTSVNFSFTFPDYTPALDSRSAGDAMGKIRTLWIAVYYAGGSRDGEFVEKFEVTDFTGSMENRPGEEEFATGCAKFKMTYPNGRYRMYAIANHDLSSADISTEDKLMHLPLTWEDLPGTGIDHNDQMFGWFRNDTQKPADYNAQPASVTIKPDTPNLHAWVRRAASKLTVAFNTNGLNENVKIYLKSISVIDMPAQCYLHSPNNFGEEDYRLKNEFAPRTASSTIYFRGAEATHKGKEDHLKWPIIGAGDLIFGLAADQANKKHNSTITLPDGEETNMELYQSLLSARIKELTALEHAQTVRALYFYENMQAPGVLNTPSDKRQMVGATEDTPQEGNYPSYPNGNYGGSHNEDGSLKDNASELGWKDARPWGTYVEIKGYYENTTGKGDITYRFMLGKNTTTSYEVERNHHYKLTLVFNGDANDVDFHIDYEEEAKPGLFTPTETYVPYLYNQESFTTVRATPKPGYDLFSLKAVIIDNEWRPHDSVRDVYYWGDAWDYQVQNRVIDAQHSYAADSNYPKDDSEAANNCEFGFLSLWKQVEVSRDAGGHDSNKTAMVKNMREFYYKYQTTDGRTVSCGSREYPEIPSQDGTYTFSDTHGEYTVTRSLNPTTREIDYVAKIPLFTRAKTLGVWNVYTGANPYYEHYRYARIKFIATYKKIDSSVPGNAEYTDVSYTNVLQSKRIDNPRGIYRSDDNLESFHVNLKYMMLDAGDGQKFEPVVSRGPWTAIIESDPDGLVSLSANGQRAVGQGSSITGRTNTEIDFVYKPLKKATSDNPLGAIITVLYHNNSCVHKIVVKQGYGATTIGKTATTKFSSFNVYDSKNLVKNPLSPGSFFRAYQDISYPIAESNDLIPSLNLPNKPTDSSIYHILGKGDMVWSSIQSWNNPGNYDPFYTHTSGKPSNSGFTLKRFDGTSGTYKIPTYAETLELGFLKADETENLDNDINFAFGITYGDGATETLSTEDAYSFSDPNNTGGRSKKGMRGIIIYSKETGDNIFFPLGALGHGRRRNRWSGYGLHRYGDLDAPMTGNNNLFRPLAWNLYEQFGAVYWASDYNNSANSTSPVIAMDFNYGNYMVIRGKAEQFCDPGKQWDALLMRLVQID